MKNFIILFFTITSLVFVSCAAQSSSDISVNKPKNPEVKEVQIPKTRTQLVASQIEQSVNTKTAGTDSSVPLFYSQRSYRSAWFNEKGFGNENTRNLLTILRSTKNEGLNPEDYNLGEITQKLKSLNYSSITEVSDLDILLTSSVLTYSKHLLYGNPQIGGFEFENRYVEPETNLPLSISSALEENRITEFTENLKPVSPVYKSLISSLEKYEKIKETGGWPSIKEGKKLKLGSVDPRVAIIRRRLIISGDLPQTNSSEVDIENIENKRPNPNDTYDINVENAVKKFQKRHNLLSDGVVGKSTVESLNVPVEEKINQIKINLNLWRKLPNNLGNNRFVLVNIPFYRLYAFENNRPVEEMKVIVGKRNWNTPVFSDEITYLEVNPYWNVPKSILAEDIIPKAKNDPSYIERNNIEIVDGWGSKVEDETSNSDFGPQPEANYVNWNTVNPNEWSYRLRQKPGPGNPLGRIKFMFPNKHNVYLHDTPLKKYFKRTSRNLSHGCIRVERPLDLADFLLYQDPNWSSEQIEYQIRSGSNKILSLNRPIPVHIMYFTVWADGEETHFTEDIYNLY